MNSLFRLIPAAALALFLAPALHAAKPQQFTSPDQVPEGLAKSDWSSIRAAYEAGRHAFHAVDGGWQARNPGQQWTTHFDGKGFLATPKDADWQWGLEFKSYGFGDHQTQVSGTPAARADGQRLTYQWNDSVQEWFVNDQRGLEHGFIITQRPATDESSSSTSSPLSFTLATRGSLRPSISADAQTVHFRDASNAPVLNYSGLKVWDADGKILASRFEATGENQIRLLVDEADARYPLTIDPIAQQAYLKASNNAGTTDDQFGYCVAVSGDTVIVGAYQEDSGTTGPNTTPDEGAPDSGAVYVFVRSGTTWSQQAYLKASNTGAGDQFGWSVAVSGDTVVVGAKWEDSSTTGINSTPNDSKTDAGAAYVFVRSGTTWSQQAYLKAPITEVLDQFGQSLAVNGDTVVVGANGENSSTTGVNSTPNGIMGNAGAAYVFVRSGTTWSQQAYLKSSNSGADDQFGESVAVSGDTVVVGAINEDSSTTGVNSTPNNSARDSGAAYVFVRSGTTWSQQAYLKPAAVGSTQVDDYFGTSVAISGNTVVVGASGEDSSTTGINSTPNDSLGPFSEAGAAYVFVRNGSTWSQQAYLKGSNTQTGDLFGISVAVSGDTLVVGARGEDSSTTGVNSTPNDSASNSGAAYVFVRSGTTWSQQAYLKASNTGANDWFGWSVAVSGDTVVVGAFEEDSSTTGINSSPNEGARDTGATYVFVRSGTTWSQQAYLKASNTPSRSGDGDFFGYSVAVSGDTVVIGAYQESSSTTGVNSTPNDSAINSGAAYVFVRSGTTWSQQAYLKASNTGVDDRFGYSVAVSGDTVVIGAYQESSSTTGVNSTPNEGAILSGAAYVFVRSGTTWSQQAYLKASNTGAGDQFGISVAVNGDSVVVGANGEDSNTTGVNSTSNESASSSGAAYVFTRSGTAWSQQTYLKASNTGANDQFGTSVAVSGDTVVVGANLEGSSTTGVNSTPNESASQSGAVYIFARSGTTWSQQAYLKASNTGSGDQFGWSVALSGDTVLVGAYLEDSSTTGVNSTSNNSASDSGAAYVFVRSGTSWSQQAYLKASNTGPGDQFGTTVAVSGDTVVVGAINEDSSTTGVNSTSNDGAPDSGAAYVFVRSGTTWSQQAYLKASNTETTDFFGTSVGVSGDTVVVGAHWEDSSTSGVNSTPNEGAILSGAAYIFTGLGPPPTVVSISPSLGSISGGTSVTITGTGFTGATGVTIGGVAATNVVVINDTTITCTTPAGTAGTASVLVTTPSGTNAANTLLTYTNSAPVANAQSVTTAEDRGKVITLSGSDADAGTFLSYTIVARPANGSLTGTGPTQVYSPNANFNGADSFTFKVNDGASDSAVATVSLTITPVAEPSLNGPAFPEFVDPNPSSGNGFGATIVALNTGNVVITSPQADIGGVTDCGAVYLFNGTTGALISTLRGSTASDQVGTGVTALTNGNYVVRSSNWDNGAITDAGAVTWGNGSTGITGPVSASNSLIGSKGSDQVGGYGMTALTNGNYVVSSPNWDNGAFTDAGAVTWGSGSSGISGVVSAFNSLVGSKANDQVGGSGVIVLTNGNYVVRSQRWDNGAIIDVGAVTWGNGSTGISGVVSASNSLIGSKADDNVSSSGVTALTNGNYVVSSQVWDNGATTDVGAVTWGNGSTGISGLVSASNSLIGSTADNVVGLFVIALTNGNYVVSSSGWDNGATTNVGAVTWGNGSTGISGVVSASNSLVGSTTSDRVGGYTVIALTSGNYVVSSPNWDNGAIGDAGAVTWGNGSTGISGVVSASNSLVGSSASDILGRGVTALSNGNYVVSSEFWDNGAVTNVGAVTWGNGSTGISGVVSASNSLVGSKADDQVGGNGVTALTNGNYVVTSSYWDNGATTDAGAVTWGNGGTGINGVVSASNSLVGSTPGDIGVVIALTNGNYVALSPYWDNGVTIDAGAVTWGNGSTGISGVVSASNSLVGSSASDNVGSYAVIALTNGNYVVNSPSWDNGAIGDAGAVTWGNGGTGISGVVSASNSLVGSTASDEVGSGGGFSGVRVLPNGNYVVRSSNWDNGAITDAGAVTWGNGSTGISGVVSTSNSQIGGVTAGNPGFASVEPLNNFFATRWATELTVRLGSQENGFYRPPVITAITPNTGTFAGGTSVIITGTGFSDTTSVTIGGTAATSVTVVNSTSITCTSPAGAVGAQSVLVTTPVGTNPANTLFTYTNSAPTALSLSANSIAENVVANSTVGALSTTDPDAGTTFTYSLVSGSGSTDNAAFNISGSSLRIIASPDFETKSSYTVRIRTTDQGGLFFEQEFIITITNVNETPTALALSANSSAENVAANSTVGTLSTTDPDAGSTFTYSLVSGSGSADNAAFNVSGNLLRITVSPDFETKSIYAVRVRTTDQGGLFFEQPFTITITDVNEAPIALALSANSLAENAAANSTVSTLSSTDPDAANTFTYTLVGGAGSTDNGAFNISSNSLRITASPDFETQSSFGLRMRTTDQGGLFFEQEFTITITDANDAPTFTGYSVSTPYQTAASISLGKLLTRATDLEGHALTVTAAGPTSTQGGTAVLQVGSILYTPANGFSGTDTFPVTIADALGASVIGMVTVNVQINTGIGTNAPVLTMLPGGDVGVGFQGIPGRSYQVQRSTDMSDWTPLTTVTAAANGAVTFIDESPPSGSGYYRLRKP